ncbi:hypothetical protein BaRGS_00019389 [Batillaria attramentaria]|uniref:Uncharacterized protein n=1 Tax=Batillaria attramentaria TaxID=370345 RepID=A0ABD0KPU8_9CAEN
MKGGDHPAHPYCTPLVDSTRNGPVMKRGGCKTGHLWTGLRGWLTDGRLRDKNHGDAVKRAGQSGRLIATQWLFCCTWRGFGYRVCQKWGKSVSDAGCEIGEERAEQDIGEMESQGRRSCSALDYRCSCSS